MDWILNLIKTNWSTLKSAPLFFVLCVGIGVFIGYHVGRWFLKEKTEVMEQRMQAKDDQLDEYRERLKMIPPDQTGSVYSKMTHNELKKSALDLVNQIREFLSKDQKRSLVLSLSQQAQMMKAKSEEERREIWSKFTNKLLSESSETRTEYDRRFKVEGILLRDELLSRLPGTVKNERADSLYEHPTNPIGMGMVADDLERMAKSLELREE